MRPAVKVARIAGASRHSRLETEPMETHSQFNLSNALPGHCVIEFIKETIRKNKGEGKEELLEVIKWSEGHENVLPSGHLSASK